MGKPFRVAETSAPAKSDRGVAAPAPGTKIVRSQQTGDPLPPPAADTPSHSPTITWPPAQADHKPMKLNK